MDLVDRQLEIKISKMREEALQELHMAKRRALEQLPSGRAVKNDNIADNSGTPVVPFTKVALLRTVIKGCDTALESIKEETYGICIDCSDQIGGGRLMAMPLAKRCTECQAEHEVQKRKLEMANGINSRAIPFIAL